MRTSGCRRTGLLRPGQRMRSWQWAVRFFRRSVLSSTDVLCEFASRAIVVLSVH